MLVPVLLFLGLHLRALDYDFVWTDQAELQHGLLIRKPGHILSAFGEPVFLTLGEIAPTSTQPYYRPLHIVLVSLIDQHLGRDPANFRAFLLAIGAATMAAFFFLVLALTDEPWAAAIAASLAAAHPAGIENYVWIAGYGGALAILFICLSLLAVCHFMRVRATREQVLWGAIATLALVMGLLSKEGAVVVPALTLACGVSLVARDRGEHSEHSFRDLIARNRPAFTLVLAQASVVLLYFLVFRPAVLGGVLSGARPIHGDWALHLLTVLSTFADRIAWLFAPLESTTNDVVKLAGTRSPAAWLGLALLLSAPLIWLYLLRVGHALAALGWAWIWIAFLPTSGLAPLTHVVAVRYMSLSVFGATLLWLGIAERIGLKSREASRRWLVVGVSALLVLGLAERTSARIPDWRSDFALFESAVSADPLYREGYYVLAVRLSEQRRFQEARARLDELRVANGKFTGHYSFLRTVDVATLLCRINLEIDDPEDSLLVLRAELRPDSPTLLASPELMRCTIASLQKAGRGTEAREFQRALNALGTARR